MANNNATIVAASLSDKDLKDSIDKLVKHVEEGTQKMAKSMDSAVEQMKRKLAELGNTKIDFGGTSDGGATRRTRSQQTETQAVKETTASYEQLAKAQQVAIRSASGGFRNADTLQTMNIQLDLLRERLREARSQYSSFVAMASHATTTGDKGLYQFATEGVHKYGDEVRTLIPQIRGLQNAIQQMGDVIAPQGHTIQNYVNSLQKASPELASLNEQYKKGQSALQTQNTEQQKAISYTEEESKKLQTLRDRLQQLKNERKELSRAMQDAGWDRFGAKIQLGAYPDDTNLKNKLIDAENRYAVAKQKIAQVDKEIVSIESEINGARSRFADSTQQTVQSAQRYTEEIRKQAQAIRESQEWKQNGSYLVWTNKETNSFSIVDAKDRRSIEEQLLAIYETESRDKTKLISQEKEQNEAAKERLETEKKIVETTTKQPPQPKTFASYDSLRESIAHVLGMQQSQIKLADTETASYNNLSTTLKQLKQAYDRLTSSERNSDQGKVLVASMNEVERAIQRIKAQAARPVSLESIIGINGKGGLSEKTLDDIAYKMQRLASYRSGLDVNVRRAEIREVNTEYDRLKKKMDEVMQKNQQMIGSNNALGRSWNYMKNRLAFYFTVGASTQFIKNLIEVRSQYEMNERALGILINSAERGTQIFNELSQMALVSPYTLIELSSAAKQLVAYDIAAKDVVDTTRRLADMAAAVGVPMERLTYALGQIKAYGYLNSRDARMFANAGIPLVKQLSNYYTELEGKMVSVGDVYDRIKKKSIDYSDVMQVMYRMTDEGGKFFDFQAKMADTLKVRLANLTLAWNNMLNDMGKETQGVLTTTIGSLRTLFLHWKDINSMLSTIAWTFGMAKLVQIIQIANIGLAAFGKQMAWNIIVGKRLSSIIFSLSKSLKALALSPTTWITLLATAATAAGMSFYNAIQNVKAFNNAVRDGAADNYKNITEYLEKTKKLRESVTSTQDIGDGKTVVTHRDIDTAEAKKAWEEMREQIELASSAGQSYISNLLKIGNVSQRLREGFTILEDIQAVNAALKEMDSTALGLPQSLSGWWNAFLLPDGVIENIKDYTTAISNAQQGQKSFMETVTDFYAEFFTKTTNAGRLFRLAFPEKFGDTENALKRVDDGIETVTKSIQRLLSNQGFLYNPTQIEEGYSQILKKIAQEGGLSPQEAFTLQQRVESARSEAMRTALDARIADEKSALDAARDEQAKKDIQSRIDLYTQQRTLFKKELDESRPYWDDFTKYIKERHISELSSAYNAMTNNGKRAMDFQSEEWQKRVHDWANAYEKSHNLSTDSVFNRLKNWIKDANTWSVFIKMTISTDDGKPIYKQLEEYDKAADDAYKTMQRLDKEISRLRKKGAKEAVGTNSPVFDESTLSVDDKKLTEAIKERAAAQEDYNKAIADGGESKKENAAASKAQKQAESELQKALKEELQLIDKVRSAYKDLTKEGESRPVAIEKATTGFEDSVANINKTLAKFGIAKLDLKKFAGITNPRELVNLLQEQLDKLLTTGAAKPAEIQDLQVKIRDLKLDADKYDLTMITKGLNNELDKLKDEYELAVELDANPELGNMFMDLWGINEETLPHTAQEYASRYTKALNKYLAEHKKDLVLPNLLNVTSDDMAEFQKLMEAGKLEEAYFDLIKKGYEATHEARQKETTDAIKNWDKLLEKYSEYQYKLKKIQDDANKERKDFVMMQGTDEQKSLATSLFSQINAATDEDTKNKLIAQLKQLVKDVAGDDETKIQLTVAIDKRQAQESARTAFEEFQKSPEWIVATGDLAGMTDKAIGGLIDRLEEYKKSAKNLDPKQIKQLNKALSSLYKQQRQGNPFAAIVNMLDQAKERLADVQPEMDAIMSDIIALEKEIGDNDPTEDQAEHLETLKERWKNLFEQGNVSAVEFVNAINETIKPITAASGALADMFAAFGNDDVAENMQKVTQVLDKAGQFAAMGAQIGGGWGAAIGGIFGGLTGVLTAWADEISGNADITEKVEESTRAVKRLESAYVDLEQAVDKAYGTAIIGARQATLANKELQLAEIQRQIELEKSRKSKNRDEDKIIELQQQYKELFYEIQNGYTEIVDELMGTDVASFAENLVSSMIDAFKQGEDYMHVFSDKFDEMIDNMIMKSIVSRVVSQYLNQIWDSIDQRINDRSIKEREEYSKAQDYASKVKGMSDEELREEIASQRTDSWIEFARYWAEVSDKDIEEYRKAVAAEEKAAKERLDAASEFTGSDVDYIMGQITEVMPELGEKLKNILGEYYQFGESSEQNLSALQQGISSISEQTANALEAYANSISQQAYIRNDLLVQIRDAIIGTNNDIGIGVQAQMLLQLQNNYIIMQSMQSMMEGWSTPSGQGIRVELIS